MHGLIALWALACSFTYAYVAFNFASAGQALTQHVEGHQYKIELLGPLKHDVDHLFLAIFDRISASTVKVTLRRLDNSAVPDESRLWGNIDGWSDPLALLIDGSLTVHVPENKEHDSLAFEINLPEPSSSRSTAIPRYIFQATLSSDELPWYLHKSTASWKELNPDWHYELCSNERQRVLIAQLEGERTARAFDDLKPGAYKADLFRYVVLYHFGGVYADDKVTCKYPLDFVLPSQDNCGVITLDLDRVFLSNGFLAMPATHPWMRVAIDAIVSNVEARSYASHWLSVTGPGLLASTLSALPDTLFAQWYRWEVDEHFYGVVSTQMQALVVIYANHNYRQARGVYVDPNHYGNLYHARNVYHELDRE